jgi:hypothetical protein
MKIYHLTILGYYNNSSATYHTTVTCNGMSVHNGGYYEFWEKIEDRGSYKPVAFYPIGNTIITSIEDIKEKQ